MSGYASLGFIGLGVMGEGMCGNLLRKASQPVFGFDLDRKKVERLGGDGLIACGSIEELAQSAELVFLSLPGGPQVEEVCQCLLAAGGRLHTIVDMSTSPASVARELGRRCAASSIDFIDAPVSRLRQAARDGTLNIMVGASEAQFTAVEPYLRFMGTDVTHCGLTGAGQVVKIINNMVVLMNVHALAEAIALGRAQGVDGKKLFDVLALGSADSFMLRTTGMKTLVPDAYPEDAFPTAYARKDIGYALGLAQEAGLSLTGARATASLIEAASAAGFEREYYPVFLKIIDGRAAKGQ